MVKLSLELPAGTDSASMQIRESLIAAFARHCQLPSFDQEEEGGIESYCGDMNDSQAIVDYYGKSIYDFLLQNAMTEHEEMIKYLEEDSTMSTEDREATKNNVMQWTFDLNMKNMIDTLGFVVYHAPLYVYYGGAHGSFISPNALTFDKKTGIKIDDFVKDDVTIAMQPLIRKGLVQYYNSCGETLTDDELSQHFIIEGELIPLPKWLPYPNATGDSLIFTYQQYEITPYADGLPTFTLAIKDLMPFLTDDIKTLVPTMTENRPKR